MPRQALKTSADHNRHNLISVPFCIRLGTATPGVHSYPGSRGGREAERGHPLKRKKLDKRSKATGAVNTQKLEKLGKKKIKKMTGMADKLGGFESVKSGQQRNATSDRNKHTSTDTKKQSGTELEVGTIVKKKAN